MYGRDEENRFPLPAEYVDSVLRETGLRVEDVFLHRGHEEFVSVLRARGQAPDYLLFGIITTGTSIDGDTRQRNYQLTLRMVDAESGDIFLNKTDRVEVIYEDQ